MNRKGQSAKMVGEGALQSRYVAASPDGPYYASYSEIDSCRLICEYGRKGGENSTSIYKGGIVLPQ